MYPFSPKQPISEEEISHFVRLDEFHIKEAIESLESNISKKEALLSEVLEWAMVYNIDFYDPHTEDGLRLLARFISYIPVSLIPKTLETIDTMPKDWFNDKPKLLCRLAAHTPEHLIEEVIKVARNLKSNGDRAYALIGLLAYRPDLLPEALTAARATEDKSNRAYHLTNLAMLFPELVSEALSAIMENTIPWERVEMAIKLTKYLPQSLIPEAFKIVQELPDEKYLMLFTSENEIVQEKKRQEEYQILLIAKLIKYLPEYLKNEALNIAKNVQSIEAKELASRKLGI